MHPFHWPQRVTIREVGLRDGLQSIARTLPTAQKLQWIQGAYDAGIREIEVGSFVPPKLLPQLADTAELVAFAKTLPGLVVSVLVPNLKGAERAMDSGADWMLLPLSASHAHSLANLRKTPDEVVTDIAAMVEARRARGSNIRIEVGMSTAFGCTLQGRVEVDEVLRLLKAVLALGVDRVGLADTVGYADPRQVGELFAKARQVAGNKLACGHFHDTRGLGMANVMAAMRVEGFIVRYRLIEGEQQMLLLPLLPYSAAISRPSANVFHDRTAHLMRTGNFTTPCNASRSPSGAEVSGSPTSSMDIMCLKRWMSARASATGLPFTAALIIDAEL